MELGLIPVKNFGILEEGRFYRSAQPLYSYEYKWLKEKLHLDKIVNLRDESKHDEQFAPKWGIVVEHINVVDHHPPTEEHVAQFIKILDETNGSLLFHCEHGHGRTSTFNVITRIYQGWSLEEALEEENTKFMYKFLHPAQIKFLKQLPEIVAKHKNDSSNKRNINNGTNS